MLQPEKRTSYLLNDEETQSLIQSHFGRSNYRIVIEESWHTNCDYQYRGAESYRPLAVPFDA